MLTGVAWDHINVFPTFEVYLEQFEKFIQVIEENGSLIYSGDDENLSKLAQRVRQDVKIFPYSIPSFRINEETHETEILSQGQKYCLSVFGKHNLANMEGARLICEQLGVKPSDFYSAISSFKGATNRLETIGKVKNYFQIFKDFAHSPSKLKATVLAVKEQFKDRLIYACM